MDEYLLKNQLELTADGKYVRWGKYNKKQPRNWPTSRKTFDSSIIFLLDTFTTATSTAGTLAAQKAQVDYHIGNTLATFIFVTLFLVGQIFGAVIFPPWSETFGRKNLYIISSAGSAVCCLIIGMTHSLGAVIPARIIAGCLSAVPYTVGGGSIEEMFDSRARIWVIFIWTIASNVGLLLGPIMSTYISAHMEWRWVFYIYAIIFAVLTAFFFVIKESRPSLLLSREVARIRHETGNETLQPLNPDHTPNFRAFVRVSLFRPLQLFFGELLIFIVAVMIAFSFSLVYVFTEALQPIYESMGYTSAQSCLAFVAIGVGVVFSTFTRFLDHRIFDARKATKQPVKPEDKLYGLVIGAPVFALALWWFAWTIPPRITDLPWIVPTIALVMIGFALNEFDTVLYGYLSDSYLSYAASGTAAVQFLRAMASGAFPLFTRQMFDGMGANVAVSVLAALATGFCAVPVLFMCYGERIRARSQFARFSLEIEEELGTTGEEREK
ncbi:hypothetical protein ASPACDRAFT_19974 [Aspergillus aculeatus ATCC 16872]|uniref:Major facilitator superfamily (MFS) profile domain-containing protein n=1 Tax=Aspergillus aculeatus (strain ATCC 16872 / CBS 172.66 / WB 5094) TaxID=690307 RepID=A0A1L9X991_ASPA1|nr:uncharacterized protein ASPACDRAFT_19974 [Aspergillus aculeatus ATCC 16872]OJK04924.1 hypothetical protein ASPACDRAFT_19974 [Aspergillus aculeatus ATCC 16872]